MTIPLSMGATEAKSSLNPIVAMEFNMHQPAPKNSQVDEGEKNEPNLVENSSEAPAGMQSTSSDTELEISAQNPVDVLPEKSGEAVAAVTSGRKISETTAIHVLKGQITYTVPSGTPIKLKLATVPSHPMGIMNRDFDGNLYPARLGQQITAKTTENIYVDHNKIIPEGTTFCGSVSKVLPPRRVGRPGSLVLSFNQLITPDGRKFAFKAEANNFKASTTKTKAKGFGIIAAHAAGGAVVGALVAYELFGMEKTIALHGYNIAGGAAGGALLATGYAIMRKGPKATLEPGDDLNMSIDGDLLMPIASEPPVKSTKIDIDGLKIEIASSKIVSDGLGGHFVTIEATIDNDSDEDLSAIDLFLEDSNGDLHPLCSGPEEDSQFLFHIEPHQKKTMRLSFLTPYPKLKQSLVWLDHNTKIALARHKIQ